MPTPDLSGYVDLTLYDKDAEEVADDAIADAQAKLPEWVPTPGQMEVVLIEAFANIVSELIFAINRLPSAVFEALLGQFSVTRDAGVAPTTTVAFEVADDSGHTIPGGTSVLLEDDSLSEPVQFVTAAGLVIAAGDTTGTIAATATSSTVEANGFGAPQPLTVVDPIPYIVAATLASDVIDGVDPETPEAFRDRAQNYLQRLVTTLVIPEHFTYAALTYSYVDRATTIDNTDPANAAPYGDDAGHVTVVVLGPAGALVSGGDKTALEADLEAQAQANLDVHVTDPTITDVDVTALVHVADGFDPATVQASVEAALEDYLSPQNWDWSAKVRRNALIAEISRVEGVAYLVTMTAPAADVDLAGIGPLASAGVLTITTEGP